MKKTFYAAKINVHQEIFSNKLQKIIQVNIPNAILKMPSIKVNSYNLSFTDVKEIKHEDQRLIIGNVTKSKHASQKVRIGSTTNIVTSEHELAYTSFFIYHPLNEIIVYEVNSSIRDKDFRNFFTQFLSKDRSIGEVKIQPVPEPYRIRNELESMDKITTVHFKLIHPNPGKKEFNMYNSIIQEAKLKELDIKMVNDKGLKLTEGSQEEKTEEVNLEERPRKLIPYTEDDDKNEAQILEDESASLVADENNDKDVEHSNTTVKKYNDPIENGIALVESGYGSIDIKGYDITRVKGKGNRTRRQIKNRKFSSVDSVRRITVSEMSVEPLINRLFKFILDVKEKFNSKEDDDE